MNLAGILEKGVEGRKKAERLHLGFQRGVKTNHVEHMITASY